HPVSLGDLVHLFDNERGWPAGLGWPRVDAAGSAGASMSPMWMQMIKARLKPGKEAEFAAFEEQIRAIEQPGSGWIRSTATRAQKEPDTVYIIVAFESEEAAR